MSYSFTTEPLARHAHEGEIVEAIDNAYGEYNDDDKHPEAKFPAGAAKRLVIGMASILGPNVETYKITVSGHHNPDHKRGSAKASFSVNVWVDRYASDIEPEPAEEPEDF